MIVLCMLCVNAQRAPGTGGICSGCDEIASRAERAMPTAFVRSMRTDRSRQRHGGTANKKGASTLHVARPGV